MSRKHALVATLLVIVAASGWKALVEGEFPKVYLGMAGFAILLAIIIGMSSADFAVQKRPSRPSVLSRRTGLWMMIAGAAASALWYAFAPWQPHADFDVVGVLYVLQNLGPIVVLVILVAIMCTGAGVWLSSERR